MRVRTRDQNTTHSSLSCGEPRALPADICMFCVSPGEVGDNQDRWLQSAWVRLMSNLGAKWCFPSFTSPNPILNGPTNSSRAPPLKPLLPPRPPLPLFPLIIIQDSWSLRLSCLVKHQNLCFLFNACSSLQTTSVFSLCPAGLTFLHSLTTSLSIPITCQAPCFALGNQHCSREER